MVLISSRPFKRLRSRGPSNKDPYLRIRYFPRGRDALTFGVRTLFQSPGTIVFPGYYCESSVRPLQDFGFTIKWIDVNWNLTYDLDKFASILDSPDVQAIVICDYFGWCAPNLEHLINLANEKKVAVIRDCCHCSLSWAGRQHPADITVFSFRKAFPIWDGGGLLLRDHNVGLGTVSDREGRKEASREVYRILEHIMDLIGFSPYELLDSIKPCNIIPASNDPNIKSSSYPAIKPSKVLLEFLESSDTLELVSSTRRKNFIYLRELLELQDLFPIFLNIGKFDVPQIFPLVVERANSLISFLRSKGVGAVGWPSDELPAVVRANPDRFPVSISLSNSIVCLPLHQDLTFAKLRIIANLISMWRIASGVSE